jgi:hypothetical protein
MATNDSYLRPDAGDGANGVKLRADAPDSGGGVNYTLVCAVGAYSYLGLPATLSVKHSLTCATGAYSYAGIAATLSLKRSLLCATGAYAYAGLPATLTYGGGHAAYTLTCATGSYAYTGLAATLNVNHSLLCNVGAYAYTGQAATLTYVSVSPTAYTLFCDHGGYLYSGISAKLDYVTSKTKQGGDDVPRSVKNLKYKPKPRKDDFGNEIIVPEAISALTVEKYTQKPTRVSANELQSHLEIDDEEAILMFI